MRCRGLSSNATSLSTPRRHAHRHRRLDDLARGRRRRFPAKAGICSATRGARCVEINSSFHRSHRAQVYQRWAAQTPPGFRFSVKVPRSITHEGRLRRAREPLRAFSPKPRPGRPARGALVQLPPSFPFEARPVRGFFGLLAELFPGRVVCEPRHASWFTPAADRVLAALRVARAAADPARCRAPTRRVARPRGDGRGAVLYHRWHGAPRMYWSRYEPAWVSERAEN